MLRQVYLAISLLIALPASAQDIRIEDAYARVTLHSGAVFLHIINTGAGNDRLLSVSTLNAKSAMLHENIIADNIASMKPLMQGLEIPGNATTELERAGNHIMLMGLTAKLDQGISFPLTLVFESAGEITIDVLVDNARPAE